MTDATATTTDQQAIDAEQAQFAAKIAAIKASISSRYLPIMALFAAKDDTRPCLKGVHVCPAPAHLGGIYLVASNGHAMAVIHDKNGTIEGADRMTFCLTKELVATCEKKSKLPHKVLITGYRLTVVPDFDLIGTDTEAYVIPGRALIDKTDYPNWRNALPDFAALKPGMASTLQAKYLAIFSKISPKNGDLSGVRLWHQHTNGMAIAQVTTIHELLVMVMDMHDNPESGRELFAQFPSRTKPKEAAAPRPAMPSDAAPPPDFKPVVIDGKPAGSYPADQG